MIRQLLIVLLLGSASVWGQSNISARYFGMTIHPFGDEQAALQPNRLDKNARFVTNLGGFITYEKFIWQDIISIKGLQAVFTDCSGGMATVTNLSIQTFLFETERSRLSACIGPAFMIREDWNRLEGYKDGGFFNRYQSRNFGPLQYKMFWYGFEFVYNRKLTDKIDLEAGFTPGVPLVCALSLGLKYWFSKDFKIRYEYLKPQK